MASNVVIHEDAQLEILNALEYYREISEDLSHDLLEKLQDAIAVISHHPHFYPVIRGAFRKINLSRFPFKIIFKLRGDEIFIIAFMHHKQRPTYWSKR